MRIQLQHEYIYIEILMSTNTKICFLVLRTQLNDVVYGIVQPDTIEQYKTHHLMLDKLFQDTVEMIVSNKQVLQNS